MWSLVSMKVGFPSPAKRGVGFCAYLMDIPCAFRWLGESNEVGMQWSMPWCRTERAAGHGWFHPVELCGLTEQYGWLCILTGLVCNHTRILPWENPACSRHAGRHCSAAAVHWTGVGQGEIQPCCMPVAMVRGDEFGPENFLFIQMLQSCYFYSEKKGKCYENIPRQKLSTEALTGRIDWLCCKLF